MNFNDIKELEQLTEEDYKSIGKLADNKNFKKLREIIEGFQVKRSYNLINGIENNKGDSGDELKSYRGGAKLWRKVMDLIDNSEEYINAIQNERDSEDEED